LRISSPAGLVKKRSASERALSEGQESKALARAEFTLAREAR